MLVSYLMQGDSFSQFSFQVRRRASGQGSALFPLPRSDPAPPLQGRSGKTPSRESEQRNARKRASVTCSTADGSSSRIFAPLIASNTSHLTAFFCPLVPRIATNQSTQENNRSDRKETIIFHIRGMSPPKVVLSYSLPTGIKS